MKKFRNLLRQPEFHVFLFCMFFVLICLPFLVFPGANKPVNMFDENIFYYFFILWGVVIALLFFIVRSLRNDVPAETENEKDGDTHV